MPVEGGGGLFIFCQVRGRAGQIIRCFTVKFFRGEQYEKMWEMVILRGKGKTPDFA